MSMVKVVIDKKGKITMNYEGFVGQDCNIAEGKIREKLHALSMTTVGEERKGFEDRKMELERQ